MDVEALLRSQGGIARRRQLLAAGVSRRGIDRAVAAGHLRLVAPYIYGPPVPLADDRLRAAVVGLRATISHESAALAWGIELVSVPQLPHVTVPRNRNGSRPAGVQVCRRDIPTADLATVDGLPVTTVLRTLLDLCRHLPLQEAVASVDSALRNGLVSVEELTRALRDLPAGRGRQRVARALRLMDPASGSVLESVCRVLMAERSLPRPETQYVVRRAGRWVGRFDFAWPDLRLIVETDGFAFHSDRAAYRKDRRRLNSLQLAGWVVLRFSWEDVLHHPDYVVECISAAIAERLAA
jgi:very-short-patch-repair endonuclease